MSYWKSIDQIFLYDGSFEGLLTIVFDCYLSKEIPFKIVPEKEYMPNLFENTISISTDYEKSSRIFSGISKSISDETLYHAYHAFLSANAQHICDNKELEILKYLLHGFCVGPKVNTMLSIPYVLHVMKLRKNVMMELDRLEGFTRLQEIVENLFYASIHPENNLIEKLGKFLLKRFPTQNLILHDKNRGISFLYNTKEYTIVDMPDANFNLMITEKEKDFQSLWKVFFQTIAIKERTNPRCQMQHMPKKYWQDLIEMK